MLDQNTTTVLTTLISVIGTLSGVVLGVILSNRYVARHEKAKRNTAIIEEIYTLLTKVDSLTANNIDEVAEDFSNLTKDMNRIDTLIYLYFPALKEKLAELAKSISLLQNAVYVESVHRTSSDTVWETVSDELHDYGNKRDALKGSLEKLVK
ncbi:MAG TPA: hypothetical protein VEP90_23570 [Methylomirabilota bacterium]|nr:hypothetical protein [Methylomirabilota bacterium]